MEGSLVAYKVFTNGSPLQASEVNDNLMNQSVIVFSSSSTRASAITSPVEGMLTYLEDTNTYQYWNGTAWTDLVGAPAASGALTLVKAQTIGTAVSSVTVTDAFSATYDNYLIIISDGVGTETGANTAMTLGSTTSGYYFSGPYLGLSSSTVTGFNTTNGSHWTGSYVSLNAHSAHMNIQSPFLAKRTLFTSMITGGHPNSFFAMYGGFLNNTTSYTSFTLTVSSGTMTGGVIRVYGYQNA
jgi:hypothetical protein